MKKRIRDFSLIILILIIFSSKTFAALPELPYNEGIYIYDADSNTVIYEQNESEKFSPASITKLLTALVLTDTISDLNQNVSVGNEVNDFNYLDSRAMLYEGQVLSYHDLLNAMLVPSGNDAAQSIAVNVGKVLSGSQDRETVEAAFYEAMNQKAEELGAVNSHFSNPHGRYADDHYTTPEDYVKIAIAAFNNPDIKEAASTKTYKLKNQDGSDNILYSSDYSLYSNSNEMTGYSGLSHIFPNLNPGEVQPNPFYSGLITAAKTGRTDDGERTYAFLSDQDDNTIYGIIMYTDDYGIFTQSKEVLENIDSSYSQYDLNNLTNDEPIEFENSSIISPNGFNYTYNDTEFFDDSENLNNLTYTYRFDENKVTQDGDTFILNEKINKGDKAGSILIENSNGITKTVPIYASNTYYPRNILDTAVDNIVYIILVVVVLTALITYAVIRHKRSKKRKKRLRFK